jgi:lipocalin
MCTTPRVLPRAFEDASLHRRTFHENLPEKPVGMRTLLLALAFVQCDATCAPVSTLDVSAYVGRWYQVYYNPLMLLFSSPACSTALYGVDSGASVPTITVNNSGLSHLGKSVSYVGTAAQTDASRPGDLTLVLKGVPGKASYRICAVGPKAFLGKYHDWCVSPPG